MVWSNKAIILLFIAMLCFGCQKPPKKKIAEKIKTRQNAHATIKEIEELETDITQMQEMEEIEKELEQVQKLDQEMPEQ